MLTKSMLANTSTFTEVLLVENDSGLIIEAVRTVTICGTGAFYDPDDGLPLFFESDLKYGSGDGRLPLY